MYKRIKNIIAVTLIIGAFSCTLPANSFIPGSIEAHASTYKSASDGELSSLTITRSTGSEIELLDSYYGDVVSLSAKKDYYIEPTGADGFEISADVKGSGYVVKQFTSADKKEKGKDVGEYINIDSSSENIYLRTYESEEAYKESYDDDDVTDCEKTYIIHVKKPAVNSDEELDVDRAYLDELYISNGKIDFTKNQYSYDINIDENVKEILIRATPENDNDLIEINGQSLSEDNNYEKIVNLDKGKNIIKIYIENDDDNETYTLNIYIGKVEASTISDSKTQANTSSIVNTNGFVVQSDVKMFNAWQSVNGKWRYIDGTGDFIKSTWWFDKNTGKNYYLKEDGYMATGWLYNNNNWYYFGGNGEMQVDWISSDGNWYYLNKSGVMQIGSLQDSNGNWYYLDETGKMINK